MRRAAIRAESLPRTGKEPEIFFLDEDLEKLQREAKATKIDESPSAQPIRKSSELARRRKMPEKKVRPKLKKAARKSSTETPEA